MLTLEDKKAIVSNLNAVAKASESVLCADYRGLNVAALDALRKSAREAGVHVQVVRNTLAKRAFEDTPFSCLEDVLVGPMLVAFSKEEPGDAAKVFVKFVKEHEALKVTALALGDTKMSGDQLLAVSKLPTKDEAISMLMSCMMGPANQLAALMRDVPGRLVRTLASVRDQKAA